MVVYYSFFQGDCYKVYSKYLIPYIILGCIITDAFNVARDRYIADDYQDDKVLSEEQLNEYEMILKRTLDNKEKNYERLV